MNGEQILTAINTTYIAAGIVLILIALAYIATKVSSPRKARR